MQEILSGDVTQQEAALKLAVSPRSVRRYLSQVLERLSRTIFGKSTSGQGEFPFAMEMTRYGVRSTIPKALSDERRATLIERDAMTKLLLEDIAERDPAYGLDLIYGGVRSVQQSGNTVKTYLSV